MTTEELAWLAGYIDSEGCFYARMTPKSVRGSFKIASKSLASMKKAQALIREIIGRKPKLNEDRRSRAFQLQVGCKKALYRLLPVLEPFLIGKREQALTLRRAIVRNDRREVDLLKSQKRYPDPNDGFVEGAETRPGALNPEEAGWLAGLLDGDGSLTCAPPTIRLEMCTFKDVQRSASLISKLVGKPVRVKKRVFSNSKWRPTFGWKTRNRKTIEEIVKAVCIHLSEKQTAALKLLTTRRYSVGEGRVQAKAC